MEFNIKVSAIIKYLWAILLFTIVSFPRMLQIFKIFLCILIILSFLLSDGANHFSFQLRKKLVILLLLWSGYVFITIFVGIINANNLRGIQAFVSTHIIDFILWLLLINIISYQDYYEITFKSLLVSFGYIGLLNLIIILGTIIGFDISFFQSLDATAAVGMHDGYSHIVSTNLSMSMFLFPLFLFNVQNIKYSRIINKKLYHFILVINSIVMLLSGRRMIWLVLFFSLLCYMILYIKRPLLIIKKFVAILFVFSIVFFVLNEMGIVSFDGVINRFLSSFSPVNEYGGVNESLSQSDYLINGFKNNILVGNGAGAVIDGFARSSISPWSFELSYHLVLFQSGIIGSAFFIISLVYIGKEILKNKVMYTLCVFMAYLFAIISNSTNPYIFSSFDFMLWIFIPLLFSIKNEHLIMIDGG